MDTGMSYSVEDAVVKSYDHNTRFAYVDTIINTAS